MEKKRNNKGFTLAELLIVVAIIAVLVAIAIPVFTSQLEKSKEATDLSNIRSYYAEMTTGLLTGDLAKKDDTVIVGNNLTAKLAANLPSAADATFDVTVSGVTFKQSVDGWQTPEFDVAGAKGGGKVAADDKQVADWANGVTKITYTYTVASDGDYVLSGVTFAQ